MKSGISSSARWQELIEGWVSSIWRSKDHSIYANKCREKYSIKIFTFTFFCCAVAEVSPTKGLRGQYKSNAGYCDTNCVVAPKVQHTWHTRELFFSTTRRDFLPRTARVPRSMRTVYTKSSVRSRRAYVSKTHSETDFIHSTLNISDGIPSQRPFPPEGGGVAAFFTFKGERGGARASERRLILRWNRINFLHAPREKLSPRIYGAREKAGIFRASLQKYISCTGYKKTGISIERKVI